ncbi:TPA: hypothetical protein ACNVBB_000977 [Klebsiella aerogenes]
MTKSILTRERIEQYAHDPRMCNINDEIRELARMALAAMGSEPVVPEEMPCGGAADDYHDGYQDGWNACRAAMLQSEPVTTANKLGNSPVIPDGYVMVPKVPTAEMQSAGASAIRIETTALNKLWTGNAVFRAMLAAAPQEVKGE